MADETVLPISIKVVDVRSLLRYVDENGVEHMPDERDFIDWDDGDDERSQRIREAPGGLFIPDAELAAEFPVAFTTDDGQRFERVDAFNWVVVPPT